MIYLDMKSTFDELLVFVTIADCGSIVKTAEQLNQTTSAISRTLQRLEKKLNVKLIERTTRSLNLTYDGKIFLERARKLLSDLNEAEELLINPGTEPTGLIKIDSATPFVLHVIIPLIPEFIKRYPKISIELTSHDHVIDLLEHKIDVAIRFGDLEDSSLYAKLLYKSRLYIVASAEYLKKNNSPKTIIELNKHRLLGFSHPLHLNNWPIYINDQLYKTSPSITASNGESVRQLALQGVGIACLSEFLILKDINEGKLIALFEDEIKIHEQKIHAVYYKKNYIPKRVRLFIDYLYEKLQQLN